VTALLAVATAPALIAALVLGLRAPLTTVLPFYAALVPFGSGIALPLGFPPPFNTLSSLAGLVAIVTIAGNLFLSRRSATRIVPSLPVWLVFVGWSALTYLWSVDRARTVDAIGVLVSLVVLFVVVAMAPIDRATARRLEDGILVGAVAACAYGFYLLLTGALPEEEAGIPRFATAGGADTDPNITAAVLVLPLVVAVARATTAHGARRMAALAAAALVGVGILLTASRGGVVGAALAMVVLILHQRRLVRLGLVVVAVIAMAALVGTALAPDQMARFSQEGGSGREDVWRVARRACVTYCWNGSGFGTFPVVHAEVARQTPEILHYQLGVRPHNIWIGAAVETGAVSALLLTVGLLLTATPLSRLPRTWRGPPLAALVGLAATNMFLGNLSFKYFWLVLIYATVVTLAYHHDRDRERPDTTVALSEVGVRL
jgi:hypothetical protein